MMITKTIIISVTFLLVISFFFFFFIILFTRTPRLTYEINGNQMQMLLFLQSNIWFCTFAIWLTWNWNIAEFSKLLVAAMWFPKPIPLHKKYTFLVLIFIRRKKRPPNNMRWETPVCKSAKACVLFFFISKIRSFFSSSLSLSSLSVFANDLSNLWDGSIINFMCERKRIFVDSGQADSYMHTSLTLLKCLLTNMVKC